MTQADTLAISPAALQTMPKIRGASLLRMMLPVRDFCWHGVDYTSRHQVESYIANKFHTEYGANVTTFAPLLLSMSCNRELSAAVGVRPAKSSALFVEQYLDENVEHYIQSPDGEPVNRDNIVEISNLVATWRGASQLLFLVLGIALYEAGYRWLAFSATDKVERITRKFPFPLQVLCDSDPERLGERASEWGRYYETSPKVIVGDIKAAYEKAQHNRALKMALTFYRPLTRRLVRTMPVIA
ncbi:MAG: thermostable hemolysin [Gammaproteobacteria bacterium]